MGNQKELFDKLLEKFVFNTAAQFIDQVDAEMQAKIIDLLNHIGKNTPAASAPTNGNSLEPTNTFQAESYDVQLERQWKEALLNPVRNKRIKNETRGITRRLIDLYQIRIQSTIFCIGELQGLLERSHTNIVDESRQSYLSNHYQSIIDKKAAYLTKMQSLQQEELKKVRA